MTKQKTTKKPMKKEGDEEVRIELRVSKSQKTPQTLRGFKDVLPVDQRYWDAVRGKLQSFSDSYGFSKIETPIVEDVALFARSVGMDTELVQKEMFVFEDHSGDQIVLRPEATASVARAYINHGMINLPQPVKLSYMGPMFRYERPQSGRYRQFHQLGYEVLGDANPVIDAQMIIMAYTMLKELGIPTRIQINSLGTAADRKLYKQKLVAYYKTQQKYMQEHDLKNLAKNPMRLLDSKDEKMMAIREDAPQILDFLSDESKNHLTKVMEFVDELGVEYDLNPFLVRGLDYYSHTVFEIWAGNDPKAEQIALGGGGRYDGLVEILGGRPTPAAGFAIGIERVILKMKELLIEPAPSFKPMMMVAQLGDAARRKAMVLFEKLRQEGLPVVECFSKDNLKNQLEMANKLAVKYTLIIGQKELTEGTVLIRDMEGGVQETLPFPKIVKEMKKRFLMENGLTKE
jgi:histidyl-tRNA synthetase